MRRQREPSRERRPAARPSGLVSGWRYLVKDMKRNRANHKSAVELARSTGSAVAVAAFQRSGAGKHGGSARQQHRRSRQSARQSLRRGDW